MSPLVQLTFFSSSGWKSWDVMARPAIPERMPVLIDDDLRFDDAGGARPAVAVNRWLRELPSSGAPASSTWVVYARVLRDWMEYCAEHGTAVFAERAGLKQVLGAYAAHRANGPVEARFAASTWNQHVSVLSSFYQWAVAEGHASAVPFTYGQARGFFNGQAREMSVNLARRRAPKPHVTIKYLEADFAAMFVAALAGLGLDGQPDARYRGRELARNAAIARLVLSSGLRRQEFTYLLACEIPALPVSASELPVPFGVPAGVTKGRKYRTTWIEQPALEAVHRYIGLDRAAATMGSPWLPPARWGEPLVVGDADARGGRVNGVRVQWADLRPGERRRLVFDDGGSCLLAVRGDGGPFTAWESVFTRASDRIRETAEPRFPHVHPHRLRHSMALATLEKLVGGYYAQAAQLATATDARAGPDAALALYLSKADPLMVLRDLLGHSSATTTEAYLRRLDTTRIYADAYQRAGAGHGLPGAAAEREAAAEFTGDDEGPA